MKQTRLVMGMPVTVEIVGADAAAPDLEVVYAYFNEVDLTFSTYKDTSEISRINRGELTVPEASEAVRTVLELSEVTRQETNGYFNIRRNGHLDPLGLVKGWAIFNAAQLLRSRGFRNFYVDAGGDVEVAGVNEQHQPWRVGIRNPFDLHQIIKVLALSECGIATSGTSIRGDHIYDPLSADPLSTEVISLTVIGPNVYEADRFATAAFAMGEDGIQFIEQRPGLEGYQVDKAGRATFTSGFERYVLS